GGMAFLDLGQFQVELCQRGVSFQFRQRAVEEGAVDLALEVLEIAFAVGRLWGGHGPVRSYCPHGGRYEFEDLRRRHQGGGTNVVNRRQGEADEHHGAPRHIGGGPVGASEGG